MKQKIFLYLFVFALLLVLFQFVNTKNRVEGYESQISDLRKKVELLEVEVDSLAEENNDLKYFTINEKEGALTYFERQGYDVEKLIPFIQDELYKLNVYEGDEHPLVPYPSITGNKVLINKVSIVNHKWILTDFTDGQYWGELFLTYEITDKDELKFKTVEYLIYPF